MKILIIIGLLLVACPLFVHADDLSVIKSKVAMIDKTKTDTQQKIAIKKIVDEETDKGALDFSSVKFTVLTFSYEDVLVGNYNTFENGQAKTVPIYKKRFISKTEEK